MSLVTISRGSVWSVTLSRPQARNAVSFPMLTELGVALAEAAADRSARAVILAGEGPDFCAGADIDELEAAGGAGEGYGTQLEDVLRALEEHPLPLIARVQGAALGAGCQIVVACDLAVAASDARLGIPSARLGVLIGFENVERLVLSVGPKRAGELLLLGRALSGDEAARWGLVNESVPPAQLEERTEEMAREIAEAAPMSVKGSKRGIRSVLGGAIDRRPEGQRARYEAMAAEALSSEDLREGLRAFRERRRPDFRGR